MTAASIPGMPERDREKVEWACHGMPFLQSTVVPARDGPKGKGRVLNRFRWNAGQLISLRSQMSAPPDVSTSSSSCRRALSVKDPNEVQFQQNTLRERCLVGGVESGGRDGVRK